MVKSKKDQVVIIDTGMSCAKNIPDLTGAALTERDINLNPFVVEKGGGGLSFEDAMKLESIGNRSGRKYSVIPSVITGSFKDFDAKGSPPTAAKGAMSVSSLTTDTDIAFHSPLPKSFTHQQGDESTCYQT